MSGFTAFELFFFSNFFFSQMKTKIEIFSINIENDIEANENIYTILIQKKEEENETSERERERKKILKRKQNNSSTTAVLYLQNFKLNASLTISFTEL